MADPQTETYTIFCVTLGETSEFSVKIPSNDIVDSLKKAIKGEKPNGFAKIDADQLILWKLNVPISATEVDKEATWPLDQDLSEIAARMLPAKKLSHYFPIAPIEESLHIIVVPSLPLAGGKHRRLSDQDDQELAPHSKKPRFDVSQKSGLIRGPSEEALDVLTPLAQTDITKQLVARWSRPTFALPLPNLRSYLQQPLVEYEKIPIQRGTFDWLSRDFETPERELGAEQVATLFRVSTDEARRAEGLFVNAIESATPTRGTEELFHSTWDRNISSILELILSDAKPIRNSNRNASTALKRPDYGFLVKNHCILRGEEEGSEYPHGDPSRELVDKLRWAYDPLPYILGYHAITTNVDFVAITAPPVSTVHLFHHDLKFKKERVASLVHLIRLSQVMAHLGEQLHYRDRPEFIDFEREGGLVRMNIAAVVRKEFRHPDADARVSHLVEIYKLLKHKNVPNVDDLNHAHFLDEAQGIYPQVYLSPVGHDALPESGSEALSAVVCVLGALEVMHSAPNPVYHRDIRGPNIIKRFDDQGWFLIDWSDASTAPTRAVTHLKESEHSPRVREDNHGAEVDMWGVGRYLEDLASRVTCGIAKPDAVQQMARRWMTDLTTSAAAALDEINANQGLFTTRGSD